MCGETNPTALVASDCCYACSPRANGKHGVEKHHLAGRANSSFAVPLTANDHRIVTDLQVDWPHETLRNPDGSPLLLAAALLRGFLDVLRLIVERLLWITGFLERLDHRLGERLGGRWWEDFGWQA